MNNLIKLVRLSTDWMD